jgi:hypothetical protein
MNDREKIIQAFPAFLKDNVSSLLEKISLTGEHNISRTFEVIVAREKLKIPYRIYFEEPKTENLTETELLILNCLFTRHNDGFIRQKKLAQILSSGEYWITPFVMQILGEYVREILLTVEENLSGRLLDNLVLFIEENPKFFETTKSRVTSYWNCYYRNPRSSQTTYVGFRILTKITLAQTKSPHTIAH